MVVQTERQVRFDTDKTPTDAPMYFDPTWHGLPLLHRCSGGKTARLHQVTSQCEPHRRAARTRSSQYGNAACPANIECECDPSLDVELREVPLVEVREHIRCNINCWNSLLSSPCVHATLLCYPEGIRIPTNPPVVIV